MKTQNPHPASSMKSLLEQSCVCLELVSTAKGSNELHEACLSRTGSESAVSCSKAGVIKWIPPSTNRYQISVNHPWMISAFGICCRPRERQGREEKRGKAIESAKCFNFRNFKHYLTECQTFHLSASIKRPYKSEKDASEPKQMIRMIDDRWTLSKYFFKNDLYTFTRHTFWVHPHDLLWPVQTILITCLRRCAWIHNYSIIFFLIT